MVSGIGRGMSILDGVEIVEGAAAKSSACGSGNACGQFDVDQVCYSSLSGVMRCSGGLCAAVVCS